MIKKILLINTESESEIKEIERISKSMNKTTDIGIRLNPNTDAKTLSQISTGKKENNFHQLLSFICFSNFSDQLILTKSDFFDYETHSPFQKIPRKDDLVLKTIDTIKKYLKLTDLPPFKLVLKTKYVWCGKTFKGIDCSALLQVFNYYNENYYPRDTVDQIRYSKRKSITNNFKKGDIIFWKGHVAMCLNSKELIHAYGPEKKVLIMPIFQTIKRIEETAQLKVKKISYIKY